MEKLVNYLLSALNRLTVSGKENHELVLGCLLALEKLKKDMEGVYHDLNGEGKEIHGADPVSAAKSGRTDDRV